MNGQQFDRGVRSMTLGNITPVLIETELSVRQPHSFTTTWNNVCRSVRPSPYLRYSLLELTIPRRQEDIHS